MVESDIKGLHIEAATLREFEDLVGEFAPDLIFENQGKRTLGAFAGQIQMAPDFDETPKEVIDGFYGSRLFPGEDAG